MLHPNDKIGPYTLIRILGRGGAGEVWLAERRSTLLTMQVALKMPLIAETDIAIVRQEAELWLKASGHPNIVPVLDAEVYDGQVVIASEFVAGGSLLDWMRARRQANRSETTAQASKDTQPVSALPNDPQRSTAPSDKLPARMELNALQLQETIAIANGILAGLDYLHRCKLTHRDMKPDNVMLQDGIPRLTDFGLARILKSVAHTDQISGTPRYMAPETFSGSYSVASDLWAVGVVLYELLADASPFPEEDMMALILAIQNRQPEPLHGSVPEGLSAIVARLLAKTPTDRYPSASAVREALRNALNPSASAPLATPEAPILHTNNLPVQTTSFIGREKEIAEIKARLAKTRLLTIIGAGGCGKTRLSLQTAADELLSYPDGVWFVELAPVSDPSLVPQTVSEALGIREASGEALTQTLISALKDKSVLLILDNCEHLLEGAARLADALLKSCSKLKVLASSREPLGIAGERSYRAPSLSLPQLSQTYTPESLSQYESVRLFVERAVAAKSDFALTSQNVKCAASICYHLDGIPLAIELAAARVRAMPLEQIENRLDNRFRLLTGGNRTGLPRHQTLRALIDWSYNLLNPNERAMLHRLSAFAGGWTLQAAEQVCAAADIEDWEALDLLTSLVDKSLVVAEFRADRSRYRLLETVKEYAREAGEAEAGLESVYARHLEYFRELAENSVREVRGTKQADWLERLELEHDNFRTALTWGIETERTISVLRLVASLGGIHRFWYIRGYLAEGLRWLEASLECDNGTPTKWRAAALAAKADLDLTQGEANSAEAAIEESLSISRSLDHSRGIATALRTKITIEIFHTRYDEADQSANEALELSVSHSDGLLTADILRQQAVIALGTDDKELGEKRAQEALAIYRSFGDSRGVSYCLHTLGNIAYDRNEFDRAIVLFRETIAADRKVGYRRGVALALTNMGLALTKKSRLEEARDALTEGLVIRRSLGVKLGFAYSFEAFADLAISEGQKPRWARLCGAAHALREKINSPLPAGETLDGNYFTPDGSEEPELVEAWREGAKMSEEQAIDYALGRSECELT